ncbi:MAG: tetratricopeptide repeat protein [Planctomycetes bacterium]|nr:tetratricopeptide repeat protein [Planctomycetota bacterium]
MTDSSLKAQAARDAQHRCARALFEQGRLGEAVAAYEALLAAHPEFGTAYFELAGILDQHLQRSDLALVQLARGLERAPADAGRFCNSIGVFKLRAGDLAAARTCFEGALLVDPMFADAHANLGLLYYNQNSMEAALEHYARAVELAPAVPQLLHNYTLVLSKAGKGDEAIRIGQRALKLDPQNATGWHNLGLAQRARGRLADALVALRKSVAIPGHSPVFHSDLLMISLYDSSLSQSKLVEAHRGWARCHAPARAFTFDARPPGRRLKIGYVSADLRRHPVGQFLAPVVEAHDRKRFEVFAYSSTAAEDSVTQHFVEHCDHFQRVSAQTDEQLAELIHRDGIDILFDLSGHTAHNRLITFAQKPAPIQVSWLGYPFTTGLTTIDYFISDGFETPAGFDRWFTEKLVRMPDGYVCVRPSREAPPVGPLPALSEPQFTFGCFNNLSKMTPEVVALWSEILNATEPSRLLLHTRELDDITTQASVREQFDRHGVASERLILIGGAPQDQLLARYGLVDLALDPFPYCGGLTTCEALWMGVPVVTLPAERFCGRHSLSHLHNVGLPQFAAGSKTAYRDIACAWRQDLTGLAALRSSLRAQMQSSALVDGVRFTRAFERELERMVVEQGI